MTVAEILTELVGHYAYDGGATDSGVSDPKRLAELRALWRTAVEADLDDYQMAEALWVREYWLSDEALKAGYRVEDVLGFCRWMEETL